MLMNSLFFFSGRSWIENVICITMQKNDSADTPVGNRRKAGLYATPKYVKIVDNDIEENPTVVDKLLEFNRKALEMEKALVSPAQTGNKDPPRSRGRPKLVSKDDKTPIKKVNTPKDTVGTKSPVPSEKSAKRSLRSNASTPELGKKLRSSLKGNQDTAKKLGSGKKITKKAQKSTFIKRGKTRSSQEESILRNGKRKRKAQSPVFPEKDSLKKKVKKTIDTAVSSSCSTPLSVTSNLEEDEEEDTVVDKVKVKRLSLDETTNVNSISESEDKNIEDVIKKETEIVSKVANQMKIKNRKKKSRSMEKTGGNIWAVDSNGSELVISDTASNTSRRSSFNSITSENNFNSVDIKLEPPISLITPASIPVSGEQTAPILFTNNNLVESKTEQNYELTNPPQVKTQLVVPFSINNKPVSKTGNKVKRLNVFPEDSLDYTTDSDALVIDSADDEKSAIFRQKASSDDIADTIVTEMKDSVDNTSLACFRPTEDVKTIVFEDALKPDVIDEICALTPEISNVVDCQAKCDDSKPKTLTEKNSICDINETAKSKVSTVENLPGATKSLINELSVNYRPDTEVAVSNAESTDSLENITNAEVPISCPSEEAPVDIQKENSAHVTCPEEPLKIEDSNLEPNEFEPTVDPSQAEAIGELSPFKSIEGSSQVEPIEDSSLVDSIEEELSLLESTEGPSQVESIEGPSQVEAIEGSNQVESFKEAIEGQSQVESIEEAIEGPSQVESTKELSQVESIEGLSQVESTEEPSQCESIEGLSQVDSIEGPNQVESIEVPSQDESIEGPSQESSEELSQVESCKGQSQVESTEGPNQVKVIEQSNKSEEVSEICNESPKCKGPSDLEHMKIKKEMLSFLNPETGLLENMSEYDENDRSSTNKTKVTIEAVLKVAIDNTEEKVTGNFISPELISSKDENLSLYDDAEIAEKKESENRICEKMEQIKDPLSSVKEEALSNVEYTSLYDDTKLPENKESENRISEEMKQTKDLLPIVKKVSDGEVTEVIPSSSGDPSEVIKTATNSTSSVGKNESFGKKVGKDDFKGILLDESDELRELEEFPGSMVEVKKKEEFLKNLKLQSNAETLEEDADKKPKVLFGVKDHCPKKDDNYTGTLKVTLTRKRDGENADHAQTEEYKICPKVSIGQLKY